jgi:hypothetical protein
MSVPPAGAPLDSEPPDDPDDATAGFPAPASKSVIVGGVTRAKRPHVLRKARRASTVSSFGGCVSVRDSPIIDLADKITDS